MFLLGLTGGIGMGKSTAARILSEAGYPVADTDLIAREVVEPGTPGWHQVVQAFGQDILQGDHRIDRGKLASLVFAEPPARLRLEGILHPIIRREWGRRVENWRGEGHEIGAVIIPLLFETRAESEFDAVACTACSPSSQAERLRARGWTQAHAAERIAAQLPVETKMQRADFVVWTDVPVEMHQEQWRVLLRRLIC